MRHRLSFVNSLKFKIRPTQEVLSLNDWSDNTKGRIGFVTN